MSNEFINLGSANSRPEDFNLRYISISKYEDDWHSLPHTHQFSELFYVLRGEGIFYIEDKKVSMKTDDLMIINPYVEHTEKHSQIIPWNILCLVSKVLPSHLMTRTKMVLKAIASIAMVLTKISLLTSHNS